MKVEIKHTGVYEFIFDIKNELPDYLFYIDYENIMKSIPTSDIIKISNIVDIIENDYKSYDKEDAIKAILRCLLIIGLEQKIQKDLYFLQSENGLIKIGISGNVKRRVSQLEKELNTNIKIIKVLSGLSKFEKILHHIFEDDNIIYKNQTEWFYPSIKLNNFVSEVSEKNIDELCQIR